MTALRSSLCSGTQARGKPGSALVLFRPVPTPERLLGSAAPRGTALKVQRTNTKCWSRSGTPTALLAGAGGVRAVRVPKYLTGKLATSDRVIYRSQSSSRDVIPRFANTTKAEHSRLNIFCAVGRAACRRGYETALQARVLSAAQASECYDQLISESTPKDLPELPIESSKLALVITQARVVLQLALSGIWRENSLGGGLDFGDAFYIPFYDAFGLQATQVLKA